MDSKVAQPTITTVVVCCATCWKGVCCGTGCCGPVCCVVQLRLDNPSCSPKSLEPCGGKSNCCTTKCEPNVGVELSISPKHDPPAVSDASTTTVTVSIKGVTCADCALMIEDTLKKSTGIVRVRVSPITTQGEVIFEHGRITEKEVLSKISSLGYEPTLLSSSTGHSDTEAPPSVLRLLLKDNLKPVVEKQLREKLGGHPGCVDMKLQSTNTVVIRYDPAQTGPRSFISLFSSVGVTASVLAAGSTASTEADETTRAWKRRFWQSLGLCAPVIVVAYILPSIGGNASGAADEFAGGLSPATLVAWICATPIQFWICWPLYVSAYKAARYGGSVNMDTLVVLSTSVAYGYSTIATLSALAGSKFSTEVFFETSAILITLIMLGRTLEVMAKGKASQVLMRIMELQATSAVLMVPPDTVLAPCCSGKEAEVACASETESGRSTTLHNATKKEAANEPCSNRPDVCGDRKLCGDQKSAGACSPSKKGDCCDLPVGGSSKMDDCGREEVEISKMKEHPIDANLIHRGDILKVLPGTKVPTDGVVVVGTTTVDEAMVTGESVPVPKKIGDVVFGSTVNQNGTIYVRVTKTIQENTLSAISKLVQDAQTSKAPVQRIADKIATYLVPGVIVVSVATLFIWYGIGSAGRVDTDGIHPFTFALRFGLATLVVSCPCAVGLAVPTAIMSATGVGAKLGILFKDGGVIEACHKVRAIVFDKTGTLTQGKPAVVASKLYAGDDKELTESKFWFYIGSAESGSEHIIGKAVTTHARAHASEPLSAPVDYVAVPGKGLKCSVAKRAVLIGTDVWMRENNVELLAAMVQDFERFQAQAYTVIWVAVDGVAVGLVALHDQLKPESKAVVSQLTAMGIDVWMMSGDNSHTASIVADLVGIAKDRVLGRVLPGDKAGKVKALQKDGTPVAMVGDGVNDSPALAQADVGIAVASGTDMALEAARVILLKNDLRDVLVAVDLSRRTFVRIKWNFVWAFTYNLIAMMLATGMLYPVGHVYIPPAFAGISEVVSSVPVVLFSLLLQAYTPPLSIKSQ